MIPIGILESSVDSGGGYPSTSFVLEIKTDNVGTSNDDQIGIYIYQWGGGTIDFTVYWGDGDSDYFDAYTDGFVHTYPSAGTYEIEVVGTTIEKLRFGLTYGDDEKAIDIKQWGNWKFWSAHSFWGCSNLDCSATDGPIAVTGTLENQFRDCSSLTQVGDWDTSGATDFRYTFRYATSFNQDISGWGFGSATNMTGFLQFASSFSNANYGLLLNAIDGSSHQNNVVLDVDASYPSSSATARANLITDGWTITDNGAE